MLKGSRIVAEVSGCVSQLHSSFRPTEMDRTPAKSFWNPAFLVNRRVLAARRKIRVGQSVVVRYRKDDPSVNRLRDWTSLLAGQAANNVERLHASLEHGEKRPSGRNRGRYKRWFRLSRDGWAFLFVYLLIFVILRFDIHRLGSSFQHPRPASTSAWIALLVATVLAAYNKNQKRLAITVGTTITGCPPYRPGRALISASGSYLG